MAPLPNPDASGVTDALLILRQCNPALVACVGILVFECLPVYWIPPLLIFINLQLGPNTEDVFCKYAFFKNGVKVCDDS